MADRERRGTAPYGGEFQARSVVMDSDDLSRAIRRMAHEIVEHNHGLEGVELIGLQTGGVPLAKAIAVDLAEIEGVTLTPGVLDVAFYRDDIGIRPVLAEEVTDIPFDVDAKTLVVVDDVLFTGRTIRAALDALGAYGRPRAVQLAVMIDRGHRELPIRPDYVGKNLPTRRDEMVNVSANGVELGEMVKGGPSYGPDRMKHLLSIADLDRADLEQLLDLTDRFVEVSKRQVPKVPALRGRTVVSLFFEDSTRTRLSFETAAKRLSADVMTFSVGTSSVKKGESLRDTVETISAFGVDAIIVRHQSSGVPLRICQWTDAAVLNGGDGWHQHPTQALLDAFTIRSHFGSLEGLRIGIVGDIKHSRVARSNVQAFTALGASVVLVAPPTLLPPSLEGWPVTVSHDLDGVIDGLDVCYLLRMQRERMAESLVPSLREYAHRYGLSGARADRLGEQALIMHPGPLNRGVEISPEAADRDNAVITQQVANGVAVRQAALFMLLGSGTQLDALGASAREGIES